MASATITMAVRMMTLCRRPAANSSRGTERKTVQPRLGERRNDV
jgi:hypothetical protein